MKKAITKGCELVRYQWEAQTVHGNELMIGRDDNKSFSFSHIQTITHTHTHTHTDVCITQTTGCMPVF